jgi:PAS domain S-box-containing protein
MRREITFVPLLATLGHTFKARRLRELYDGFRQSEQALRRSEKELRDVIEAMPATVWRTSPDGSVDFINQNWVQATGLPSEAALGWNLEAVVHPDDRPRYIAEWNKAMKDRQPMKSEVRVRRADGEYCLWFIQNVPLRDEQGNVVKWYGTAINIHDRKRAEQELRRSQAYLAEAQRLTHTGSWALDHHGDKLLYLSEEMYRIFGFDPQQGLPDKQTCLQRIHPDDREKLREICQKAAYTDTDLVLDHRIVLPDGTLKYIQTIAHPVLSASGQILEYIGTAVDITERKRAEQERDHLHQLQDELAHINRVTTLGELASIAHELKQPITAAITNAKTCSRWLESVPPDLHEAREAIHRVVKDSANAADIINRLRALYKKQTPAERELLDVNEVIREMLVLLRSEASQYPISVRAQLAPTLPKTVADRVQLQQVLMNLVLNAIEAMKDGGGELTISSEQTIDGLLRISVVDTGVGLPSGQIDQIFSAFFTTKPQGTGMGLAITRSIIEAHGGRVWVSSNSRRGATFHFTLPVRAKVVEMPLAPDFIRGG